MTDLDDLPAQYGLTRANATAYVDTVILMNMTQTAEEINVSTDTVTNAHLGK